MTIKLKLILAAAALAVAQPTFAAEYVMSASADYSGPFADVMPNAMSGLIAINNWWNKEVGEKLGVKVDIKITDMRYDAAVIARTWPSILSRDKPIMHLGFGSPDLTTLMKRLPNDTAAGVALDSSGDLFVGDSNNNAVKEVLPDGTIRTLYQGAASSDPVSTRHDTRSRRW